MIHPSWASPGRQLPPCRTWVNRIRGPHPALPQRGRETQRSHPAPPRKRGGRETKGPSPEGGNCYYEAWTPSSAAAEDMRVAAWAPLVGGRRSTKVLPLPSSLNSSLSEPPCRSASS